MNSKLTMHQLGMTQTKVRPQRRRSAERVPVVPDGITTPKVGTEIDIDLDLVVFEGSEGSVSRTPMTKLRYNATAKQWQQVSANLAGMLAFFDSDPPDDCKRLRIVRLIPSGRACYVVPV